MNSTDLNDEVQNTNSMKIKCWSLCWWELFSKVYVETLHKLNFLWLTCVNPWVWSSWPKKCIFMPSLKALQVFLKVYYLKVYFLSELWCHSGLGWWLPENWKCCGSNSSNQHGWWFGKSSGRQGLSIKKYIYIYIIYIYIYIYVYVYIHITYCDSHCDRK